MHGEPKCVKGEERGMGVYDYSKLATGGYEWIDLKGNILQVPDYTWDPILKDDKGQALREYLIQEGYDGPGDWNPR